MDIKTFFHEYHEEIASSWFKTLHADPSNRYRLEPPVDLRNRIYFATLAFRRAILLDDWTDLKEFITQIAQKRFSQGYKVSEVQRAFELYRQTLSPLLFLRMDPAMLEPVIMKVQECMIFAITRFSEYFQSIHDDFLCNHAQILEKEIESRTRELMESREKYKTLVEDINEGFFVLSDGVIVFANSAFALMHGYMKEEVLRMGYLEFVAEESREMMGRIYEERFNVNPQVPSRIEFLRLHKDGRTLPTEIRAKKAIFNHSKH